MVIRPALAKYYVKLHYMLETSNTLNTSKILFYSNKFKSITISNQQEAKNLMSYL